MILSIKKNFNPSNIKTSERSYKNIHIYYIEHVTIKYSKSVKINSVNHLYLTLGTMKTKKK